ncbi:hypothetical protein [Ferrimonas senticii]|uniref:hypothetical protein n=1 Tax=Ferrimonas senticii TaxID=394566 RepID=UPI000417FE43|nr:hypothetical protein [Ferrimonas senticii]
MNNINQPLSPELAAVVDEVKRHGIADPIEWLDRRIPHWRLPSKEPTPVFVTITNEADD